VRLSHLRRWEGGGVKGASPFFNVFFGERVAQPVPKNAVLEEELSVTEHPK
jgi:hypothetical protein